MCKRFIILRLIIKLIFKSLHFGLISHIMLAFVYNMVPALLIHPIRVSVDVITCVIIVAGLNLKKKRRRRDVVTNV